MEVTTRLLAKRVGYDDDGGLSIQVVAQVVDASGQVMGSADSVFIHRREDEAIAAGVARGRTDGEWGNREIEDLIFQDQVIDQPARLAQPAVPPVVVNGTVVQEGRPGVDSRAATYKPRFAAGTPVVWRA